MSNIEAVKGWRKRTKQRLVLAMGGACAICNYSRCDEALEFHHLDPAQKDFGLGSARGNIKNWNSLVEEVKKCVLLCSNCHREYHAGMISMPDTLPGFDPQYEDYKTSERILAGYLTPCTVCGEMKPSRNITCGKACAAKLTRNIEWDNYDLAALYEEYGSYAKVAAIVGVTSTSVKRRMKKLDILPIT